jgi:hypothetical protein
LTHYRKKGGKIDHHYNFFSAIDFVSAKKRLLQESKYRVAAIKPDSFQFDSKASQIHPLKKSFAIPNQASCVRSINKKINSVIPATMNPEESKRAIIVGRLCAGCAA